MNTLKKTILESLHHHAKHTPRREAYVFYNHDNIIQTITYKELYERTSILANKLKNNNCANERVLILLPQGIDYIISFLACLAANAVAVPVYLPTNNKRATRVQAIQNSCAAKFIITQKSLNNFDTSLLTTRGEVLIFIEDVSFLNFIDTEANLLTLDRQNKIAFLQYTSGSTGEPKGVIISHENIMTNLVLIKDVIQDEIPLDEHVMVSWLPSYHDMGLIFGTLFPLFCGFKCCFMSPQSFMQEPFKWLKIITEQKATITGAPNFSFDLCSKVITDSQIKELDLSSLKVVFNGAEPISNKVMENFIQNFATAGFNPFSLYPAYGLAESTLFVASKKKISLHKTDEHPQGLINCGQAAKDHELIIVNPTTRAICQPYEEGEIWLYGSSIAAGYWGKPEITKETFFATLVENNKQYLKTGDLGFLDADNNLYVSGRLKDLIILNGQNIYPQDIEETTSNSHTALLSNSCAVFSIENDGHEANIIVVQEVHRHFRDFNKLYNLIRKQLYENHEIVPYKIVLLRERSLPKTSSGKVQRQLCKKLYLEHKLSIVAQEDGFSSDMLIPEPQISSNVFTCTLETRKKLLSSYLLQLASHILGISLNQQDLEKSLTSLGFNSVKLTLFLARIHRDLLQTIPSSIVFSSNNSIAQTLNYLIENWVEQELNLANQPQGSNSIPANFSQQRLWFLDSFLSEKRVYNLPFSIDLFGDLNSEALISSIKALVIKHDALRTFFKEIEGLLIQDFSSIEPIDIFYDDISSYNGSSKSKILERLINETIFHTFDLTKPFLFKAGLIKIDENHHILVLNFHHIILDGQSITLFLDELSETYNKLRKVPSLSFPEASFTYKAYSSWFRQFLKPSTMERQISFWQEHLSQAADLTTLSPDFERPETLSYSGKTITHAIPQQLTNQLRKLSEKYHTSLFTVLLSAFYVLVYRYTHQNDLIIGTPVSGRVYAGTDKLIGLLMNTLPLRLVLREEMSFLEVLEALKETLSSAQDNQDVPFDMLVKRINIPRVLNRNPLYQLLFTAREDWNKFLHLDGIKTKITEEGRSYSKFDLTIFIQEQESQLEIQAEYAEDLFKEYTISNLLQSYITLLYSIVDNVGSKISILPILSQEEKNNILQKFNHEYLSFNLPEENIIKIFEDQVSKYPHRNCLRFNGRTLTYSQLNERSNQLAHYLITKRANKGKLIAISLESSIELIIAMIAVMKTGAAYVPIDPSYPLDRIDSILKDANVELLLTNNSFKDRYESYENIIITLDGNNEEIEKQPLENLELSFSLDNTAYIIYTSGSTGLPKGSLISHKNVISLFRACEHLFNFNKEDTFCLFHSFTFDLSVWEIWGALLYGRELVIVPTEIKKDTQAFLSFLEKEEVSILTQTPSSFDSLILANQSNFRKNLKLRHIILAGEKLEVSKLEWWWNAYHDKNQQLTNMYGISETTIYSTYLKLTKNHIDSRSPYSPVGAPLDNTKIYILDDNLTPVPEGVIGEMYVGGDGVSDGYLNRPELTEQRFITDPFSSETGTDCNKSSKMYRSGDLARYCSTGTIEYLGRRDHQIKIRGFRVELGEIESLLNLNMLIEKAAVICNTNAAGECSLIAYIKIRDEAKGEKSNRELFVNIKNYLIQKVPEYMVPTKFIQVDNFPLTVNGKIDRKKLPTIQQQELIDAVASEEPKNKVEEEICKIWSEILNVKQVGTTDNFFKLGGHSLLLNKVTLRIKAHYGVSLSISECFSNPTIKHLAKMVSDKQSDVRAIVKCEPPSV
ncbi:hypothetical protein IM40_02505 [Candidatus Paracaedimonas acanthamoebae]|nr:hypothetical protein IM40_02505 [Candidatus Paracaedimonas acanthamoebae]